MLFMTPMKLANNLASSRAASFFSVFFLLLFSDAEAAILPFLFLFLRPKGRGLPEPKRSYARNTARTARHSPSREGSWAVTARPREPLRYGSLRPIRAPLATSASNTTPAAREFLAAGTRRGSKQRTNRHAMTSLSGARPARDKRSAEGGRRRFSL